MYFEKTMAKTRKSMKVAIIIVIALFLIVTFGSFIFYLSMGDDQANMELTPEQYQELLEQVTEIQSGDTLFTGSDLTTESIAGDTNI